MRKGVSILVTVLLCSLIPVAQAGGVRSAPPSAPSATQTAVKQVPEITVGFWEDPRPDVRKQISNCTHVAVIRTLMAKASGLEFANQDRLLNYSFLLCMQSA